MTTPEQLVKRPRDGKSRNFLSLLQDSSINDRYSVARGVAEVVDLSTEITRQTQSTIKRKMDAQLLAQQDQDNEKKRPKQMVEELTYWDSPEAKKLFLGDSTDSQNVVEVLKQRIERLQEANQTHDGWRDVVVRRDIDNLCSDFDKFIIRQRCCILSLAYTRA